MRDVRMTPTFLGSGLHGAPELFAVIMLWNPMRNTPGGRDGETAQLWRRIGRTRSGKRPIASALLPAKRGRLGGRRRRGWHGSPRIHPRGFAADHEQTPERLYLVRAYLAMARQHPTHTRPPFAAPTRNHPLLAHPA